MYTVHSNTIYPCFLSKTKPKLTFTQAIFAAIILLLMHAIKWIDLRMYQTICAKLYKSILL